MKSFIRLLTTALLSAVVACAVAQTPKPVPQSLQTGAPSSPVFLEFDQDRDGVLEKEEFVEARAKRAARLAAEGRMLRGQAGMADFEIIDANNDGLVTPEEFYAHQAAYGSERRKR